MLRLAEKVFVFVMLLYLTGAMLLFLGGNESATVASKSEIAVQILLYSITFLFIVLYWPSFVGAALKMKWILALAALAVASSAWSQMPAFTLRRSAILVATTAFGIYFGARFNVNEQLRVLARVFGIIVCASFLFAIFLPGYGVDNYIHPGDWQGVFVQKNLLGRAMVLSAVVFFFVRFRGGRWISWLGMAGSLILLYRSKSVSSAVVIALVIGMLIVFKLFRSRFTFAIPIFILGGLLFSLVLLSGELASPQLLRLIHRDPGLTGRTSLWSAAESAVVRRPWFGYGFKAFWLGMQGASATLVQQLHWSPAHSHNGFLDILLAIGVIGLCVFLVGYLLLCRRALLFLRRDPGHVPVWFCTYLFLMVVQNFSESVILDHHSIFWVLYVSTAVSLYLNLSVKVNAHKQIPDYEFHISECSPEAA